MDSKTKILIGVLAAGVILLSVISYFSEKEKVSFPIDNKGEAIAYAKMDVDVINLTRQWSERGWDTVVEGTFDSKSNSWWVSIYPKGVTDIGFYIQFDPYGRIITKGHAPQA